MAPPTKQNSHRAARKKKKTSFFKRHHAALMVVVVCGWLVPPLAVFIRFGIGIDFFLNIIFTCLGYIPGHVHNYYLQYIRNNYGRGRTPKWALRAGLVEDNTAYVKSTRQWGNRYGERNPNNVYDDPTAPYQDEFGNTVEPQGWVEEHGIRPAQPGAGFGPDGNNTHPEEDLLAGLPDEERERRKRAKRLHQREYGAGLEDMDQEEQERRRVAANGGSGNGFAGGDHLIDDLPEDPDVAMYRREQQPRSKKGGRFSSFGSSNKPEEEPSASRWGGGGSSSKKSGRAKKSERYGIREDHADLGGSYGRSSSSKNSSSKANKGRSASQTDYQDYQPRPSNDRYDIVDDTPSSGRRRRDDDEDFLNHQF